jgi:hypothetical protein
VLLLVAFPASYNTACLHLIMRRTPARIMLCRLPSERQICGILVDAPRSWRLARAAGTLRPAFPFSGALCVTPPTMHLVLCTHTLCTSFPPVFHRCTHISRVFFAAGSWGIWSELSDVIATVSCAFLCLLKCPFSSSLYAVLLFFPIKLPNSHFFLL